LIDALSVRRSYRTRNRHGQATTYSTCHSKVEFNSQLIQYTMPPTQCQLCNAARALVKRPKTGQQVCKSCFFEVFETEVHNTIVEGKGIFTRGEKVAIGASGGKGMYTS
jgi:hypothetical protein